MRYHYSRTSPDAPSRLAVRQGEKRPPGGPAEPAPPNRAQARLALAWGLKSGLSGGDGGAGLRKRQRPARAAGFGLNLVKRHRRGSAPTPRITSACELALSRKRLAQSPGQSPDEWRQDESGRYARSASGNTTAHRLTIQPLARHFLTELHAMRRRRGSKYNGVPTAHSGTPTGTASRMRTIGTTLDFSTGINVAMSTPCGSSLARSL